MKCCTAILGHVDNTCSATHTAMSSALLPPSSGLAGSSVKSTGIPFTVSSSVPTGPRYYHIACTHKTPAN